MNKNKQLNKWLRESQQIKFKIEIKKIANKLKGQNDYETIFNILSWIKKNFKFVKSWEWREKYLCARTALEIVKSGKTSGCGDKGLVFTALVRVNNIPAKFVDAIDEDWLKAENPKFISNHIFIDVYLGGKWRIVDPVIGNIGVGYIWPLGKKFVLYKKGLDSWDMGIKSYKDMEEKFAVFKRGWLKRQK